MKNQKWTVIKDLHNSVFIDFEKKIFRCPKDAWFKFESSERLFIFDLGNCKNETKKKLDPKINNSKSW